jgi:hypothetical protein
MEFTESQILKEVKGKVIHVQTVEALRVARG